MCEICHSFPCMSRCPNAPEPQSIGWCAYCNEPILAGEEYAKVQGNMYHEECLDDFSTSEWLELLGESIHTAEVDCW